MERGGTGARPGLAILVLLVAVAAALAPLRIALPVGIVLASLQNVWFAFVGTPAQQWKEVFVLILAARALRGRSRAPSSMAIAVLALGTAWLLVYLLRGTSFSAFAWGTKILFLFVIFGGALAALEPREREWRAAWMGMAVAVAANVTIAIWQSYLGVEGLIGLGFEYGREVRLAEGAFRVFAGFLYAAPFADFLAIVALCWAGMLLSSRPGRALPWAWVPALAGIGMILALNRTAFMALAGAVVIVALRRRKILAVAAVAAIALAAFFTFPTASTRDLISQGASGNAPSAVARMELWERRLADATLLGEGPGSAGSAAQRTNSAWLEEDVIAAPNIADLLAKGVVDNQYVSWLYSFGLIGGAVLVATWLLFLGSVLFQRPRRDAVQAAAQLVATFAMIAALTINLWEEFPINFLLAVIFGLSVGMANGGRRSEEVAIDRFSSGEHQDSCRPLFTQGQRPSLLPNR